MGANPTVAAIAWCSVSVMANEKHDKKWANNIDMDN